MLTVNLLPETARKTGPSQVEQFHRTPLMGMAAAVMVALPLVLWIPIQVRRYQLGQLTTKIQTLQPKKTSIEQLQRSLQQLRAQQAAFQGLGKGQNLWSRRLNTLSDVMPDGVWLTELSLDPAKGLVIHGSAIGQSDPELTSITKLVQGLKADADFSSAVKELQIESIKRVQEGQVEVAHFTLTCTLAESTTP